MTIKLSFVDLFSRIISIKNKNLKKNEILSKANEELLEKNSQLTLAYKSMVEETKEKNKMQVQLELSEEKYRSFILQSGLGIALAKEDGKLIEWNPKMAEYTGITKEEATELYIWDIDFKVLPPDMQTPQRYEKRKVISMDYLERLPDAPVVTIESEITKDGTNRSISITLFPIHTSLGTLIGQIAKDISTDKSYEKELKLYQDQLEQLVIKRTGELMQATSDYRELFDNTSDAIFLLEKDEKRNLRIISCNPTAKKIFDLTNDGLAIDTHAELNEHGILGEILRKNCKECDTELIQNESLDKIESNNKTIYFQTLFVPIKNDEGKTYRIAGFSRDVTAAYEVRAEQELNSVLFKTVQSLVMVVDPTGRIVRFNNACESVSGYLAKEVRDKEFWRILYPLNMQFENKKRFIKIKQNKFPLTWTDNWLIKSGATKQLLCHHSWLVNDVGEQQYLVISGTDISERLNMENAIRESEVKYRDIFNLSLDGIAILKLDMTFVELNPIAQAKLGYSRDELMQMKASDLIPPVYQENLQKRYSDIIRGNEMDFYEILVKTKFGVMLPVELNSKLIDYNGEPALLTFIRDISYRKELENKLMEIVVETEQKERKALAADLHDEIGPLLASLRMYISTLSKKLEETEYKNTLVLSEKLIKDAVDKTREISHNLSPHLLESYGLEAAIRNEIDNTKLILPILLESNIYNQRFENKIETVFYRVTKELLNNTKKYAQASNATIKLIYEDDILKMKYLDNGQGFDYVAYKNTAIKGIGLMNINNRIRTINGISNISTAPGEGFAFEMYCVAKLL